MYPPIWTGRICNPNITYQNKDTSVLEDGVEIGEIDKMLDTRSQVLGYYRIK